MPRFIGQWVLFLSAVLTLSSCTYRTEFLVRETKKETNYDSADFGIAVFFYGCLLGNGSCQGDLAIAFNSGNLSYEKLIFDTASITIGDATHSFVEGASLVVDLELKDNKKYKYHHMGEFSLSGSAKAELKLRGRIILSDASFRAITADIEYNIRKESGPVWLE